MTSHYFYSWTLFMKQNKYQIPSSNYSHRALAVITIWQGNLSDIHYSWKVIHALVLKKCTNTLYNPSIKSDWNKGAYTVESI